MGRTLAGNRKLLDEAGVQGLPRKTWGRTQTRAQPSTAHSSQILGFSLSSPNFFLKIKVYHINSMVCKVLSAQDLSVQLDVFLHMHSPV